MASCLVLSVKQAFHADRALLQCEIVILIVQEVSVSELGLRLGGSKEKTQLVSYKSPEDLNLRRSSDASASDVS
jgi:hypothetical protein